MSLVFLNAYAQDKIINNDPAINRNEMGRFMSELMSDLLAVADGTDSAVRDEMIVSAGEIVTIDAKIPSPSLVG